MLIIKEDKFVTKLIGFKSYITNKQILSQNLRNIKKPFFFNN